MNFDKIMINNLCEHFIKDISDIIITYNSEISGEIMTSFNDKREYNISKQTKIGGKVLRGIKINSTQYEKIFIHNNKICAIITEHTNKGIFCRLCKSKRLLNTLFNISIKHIQLICTPKRISLLTEQNKLIVLNTDDRLFVFNTKTGKIISNNLDIDRLYVESESVFTGKSLIIIDRSKGELQSINYKLLCVDSKSNNKINESINWRKKVMDRYYNQNYNYYYHVYQLFWCNISLFVHNERILIVNYSSKYIDVYNINNGLLIKSWSNDNILNSIVVIRNDEIHIINKENNIAFVYNFTGNFIRSYNMSIDVNTISTIFMHNNILYTIDHNDTMYLIH